MPHHTCPMRQVMEKLYRSVHSYQKALACHTEFYLNPTCAPDHS